MTSGVSLAGSGVHPVQMHFLREPVADYLAHSVEAVWQIHARGGEGDVLLFLTGQQEVETAVSLLTDRALSGARQVLAKRAEVILDQGVREVIIGRTRTSIGRVSLLGVQVLATKR